MPTNFLGQAAEQLRAWALEYPETTEGTSCNKSAFRARNKSFLFIGPEDDGFNAMLKLSDSLPEAERLERQSPDCYHVGANGWMKLVFVDDAQPPLDRLRAWLDESFRLLAPKQVVRLLDSDDEEVARSPTARTARRSTTRKSAAKKKAGKKAPAAKKASASKKKKPVKKKP